MAKKKIYKTEQLPEPELTPEDVKIIEGMQARVGVAVDRFNKLYDAFSSAMTDLMAAADQFPNLYEELDKERSGHVSNEVLHKAILSKVLLPLDDTYQSLVDKVENYGSDNQAGA